MPLPFDFEGKGVLDLDLILKKNQSFFTDFSPNYLLDKNCIFESCSNYNSSFCEPKSVLDSAKFSGRPTSSSLGGGGGGGAAADTGGDCGSTDTTNPSPKWRKQESNTATSSSSNLAATCDSLNVLVSHMGTSGGNGERLAMEDWETVLSDVSPGQEQSVFRWIMGGGGLEDPNMGSALNKVLQLGGGGGSGGNNNSLEFDFHSNNVGFGVVDHESFNLGGVNLMPNVPIHDRSNPMSSNSMPNVPFDSCSLEMKPPVFNSQLLINHHHAQQVQTPSLVFPYAAQQNDQNMFLPPHSKRHNPGFGVFDQSSLGQISKGSYPFDQQPSQLHNLQNIPHQPQFLPPYQPGPVVKVGGHKAKTGEDLGQCNNNQQQAIVDQLYKAAELVQTGNLVHAQSILARLNHQLSHSAKPFQRAAFYCKEALGQLLLSSNSYDDHGNSVIVPHSVANSSPFGLIFKIGAYKSFSEISPVVQFANFTCNQAILEVVEGYDRVHLVDFDIGFGGQWASLLQELSLRSGGSPSVKITVLASPSSHDQLELGLTCENLIQFANDINISFEFNVLGFDSLNPGSWALPFHSSEAVVVNLPVGVLASSRELSVPLVLRFVKQLSPKLIVSMDRGCDRTDLPFASHVIHALQSYTNLLESLDAVNMNTDALQKIERFLLQPGIENIVTNRFRSLEKTQHWRALFLSSGFSPINFSNFTESQAECIIKRTPVRGFMVEKRQSSLVLCWQRKELISVSAWKC